jgi:uncharacterized membrane protein (DUF106 family)
VRNVFLAVWAVYLLGVFLLPQEYVYRPSLAALDVVLWPLVVGLGNPAAVAVLAVALAILTMFGQRFLTDNRRLRVAKQRADRLRREAVSLPPDSPRRKAMMALAAPVQMRIVAAAFVPLAIILGPMVLSFVWLPERVDPASWNAKPGSTVYVAATVNGEYLKPVTLTCGEGLALGEAAPAAQAIRPIRPTLTELLKSWQPPSDLSTVPWELRAAATQTRETMLADLGEYLKGPMPDQNLVWVVRTPEGRAGRFTVTLAPQEAAPLPVPLGLGDEFPPEFREDLGDGKGPVQVVRPGDEASPIRLVKVRYVEAKTEGGRVFWAPLARLEASGWAAGWLVVYLAVYLPAMFLCRWVLRIP